MTRIERILIDADGCPVTDIAVAAAMRFQVACVILCDDAHFFEREGAQTIMVQRGADSVDFRLANMAAPADLVITQDYGLAAMCLAKKARVMHQDGQLYDESNIDGLLFSRHESKKARAAGARLKGKPKRQKQQDERFAHALTRLLEACNA